MPPGPWHGLVTGSDPPHIVQAYIEITPFDSVKYEWGAADDVTDIPQRFVERLEHYFSTYKMVPGHPSTMVIKEVYGVAHAQKVVAAAMEDYAARFGQAD